MHPTLVLLFASSGLVAVGYGTAGSRAAGRPAPVEGAR